ncbi:MAG: patatin-like phospholipase family protein [Solirubrobacteraceae bacterium]|nr:patatin-like phospholipase family protein [Solirubrobacteraceae bacterium]
MKRSAHHHPLIELLRTRLRTASRPGERTDGARIAVAIEGGGMRGAITAGMAMELERLGLRDAVDDVYGASAGTLNGAWFVSGAAQAGLPGWSDPALRTATVRRSNLLRGRPVVDGRYLTDVVYEQFTPMPFADVIASPVRLHPIATDARTGEATDLAEFVRDPPSLKLALRASTALPLLSGPPVELAGRRWFDAGLAEAIPFRTAIAQGATHVLVLRSRRADELDTAESSRTVALVSRYLSRHSAALAQAFRERAGRLVADDAELDRLAESPAGEPGVLSVRPAAGTPSIGRLERDHERVLAGLRAGGDAVAAAFAPA